MGKKKISVLLQPFKDILKFVFEAKLTIILVLMNIFVFFLINFLFSKGMINLNFIESYFVDSPSNFINLNFAPIIGSLFFHASFMHLFGNMLFLFILGRIVEKELGSLKMLLVYFSAAAISSALDNIIHIYLIPVENYASVGASGAIAGLGAAAILLSPFYITWLALGIPLPVFVVVLGQIYSDLAGIFDPMSKIDHISHLGGYLSISISMFLLNKDERDKIKKGFILSLFTAFFVFLLYLLLQFQ
jgi:membrane associated rhomboid family serine protease